MLPILILLLFTNCNAEWILIDQEGYNEEFNTQEWVNGTQKDCPTSKYGIISAYETLTRIFHLDKSIKYAAVQLVIDLLVDNTNPIEIYLNNIQQSPYKSFYDPPSSCLGYQFEKEQQYKVTFNVENNLETLELRIKQESTLFALKQIHLFIAECPQYCSSCIHQRNDNSICQACENNFTLFQGKCQCSNYQYKNNCVRQCPYGMEPNNQRICIQANQTSIYTNFKNNQFKYHLGDPVLIQIPIQNKSSLHYLEADVFIYNYSTSTEFIASILNETYSPILIPNEFFYFQFQEIDDCHNNCHHFKWRTENLYFNQDFIKFNAISKPMQMKSKSRLTLDWSVQNLTLYEIQFTPNQCTQEQCSQCQLNNLQTCLKCKEESLLFEGKCIKNCPEGTLKSANSCIENKDLVMNSVYIANQLFENNFLGDLSLTGRGWLTNKLINNVQYFGGIWDVNEFTKLYSLKPHYALTFKVKVIFIDIYPGSDVYLYYQFDGAEYNQIVPQKYDKFGGNQEIDGSSEIKRFIQHNSSELMITIGCKTLGLCYISSYQVIVHQCYPYCQQCSGPLKEECVEFDEGDIAFDSSVKECRIGYYQDNNNYCQQCPTNCVSCLNNNQCTSCREDHSLTSMGICLYHSQ